jgi:hypothetical protein
MEGITRESQSPLFGQFTHVPLYPYTRSESDALIRKFIPQPDSRLAGLLHHFSAGNPFYLVQLLRRLNLFAGRGESLTENLIKRAFVAETLSPGGLIHAYCAYLHNISLQRAKRYGVLRSILDLIAVNEDPMTQSEPARRLRMTQGAARTNQKELERIGLLNERERRYHYTDAILRYWVAYVQHGIEAPEFPGERDLMAIVSELDRKYQQAGTKLGQSRLYRRGKSVCRRKRDHVERRGRVAKIDLRTGRVTGVNPAGYVPRCEENHKESVMQFTPASGFLLTLRLDIPYDARKGWFPYENI